MSLLITRSSFLRGRFEQEPAPVRPPWALPENKFNAQCSRCDDCIDACPEGIIVRGRDGYPAVNFDQGSCTFCGDCRASCETGALTAIQDMVKPARVAPWPLLARAGEKCLARRGVECRICQDQCETRAVVFTPTIGGPGAPEINPSLCSGCGACVAPCPEQAITVQYPEGD